jgi:hypothetical protein
MWQHSVLDDHLWELFANDFAQLLELDRACKQWNETKNNFDTRFVNEMEQRITNESRREEP